MIESYEIGVFQFPALILLLLSSQLMEQKQATPLLDKIDSDNKYCDDIQSKAGVHPLKAHKLTQRRHRNRQTAYFYRTFCTNSPSLSGFLGGSLCLQASTPFFAWVFAFFFLSFFLSKRKQLTLLVSLSVSFH